MMGLIIKPILTEKQTLITEKRPNRYGFYVTPDANKLEIKRAVEEMYKVSVESVNTMNYFGNERAVIRDLVLSMVSNLLIKRQSFH